MIASSALIEHQPQPDEETVWPPFGSRRYAILAAIAYADAITAAYGGMVNQTDHRAATKLLRDTLGKTLPDAQERRFARLLGRKDEVSYGARPGRDDDASQTVEQLGEFATWARATLAARGVSIVQADRDGEDA